LLNKLKKR